MKKLILAAFALTAAVSVFAQCTILFNSDFPSTILTTIYSPLATSGPNMYVSQLGNGVSATGDYPVGTTVWSSYATIIGQNGLAGKYGASGTYAELLAAPGTGDPASSLQPGAGYINNSGITTFRTGAYYGYVAGITPTFSNLTPGNVGATLEIVAWDNSSGNYSTWAVASVAWKAGLIAAGTDLFNLNATIGGPTTPTPTTPPDVVGAQSFNLYFEPIPEPATFALAGLGLATLLVFRRRS